MGERIDLRAVAGDARVPVGPIAMPAGEHGLAVLFRYGVVVAFNVEPAEEASLRRGVQAFVGGGHAVPESEETEIRIEPEGTEGVTVGGTIVLRKATLERLLVVADVLAKSVVLAFHEDRVARAFDSIEPVAESLGRGGGSAVTMRQLLAQIGDVLMTQHRMVGRVEATEKPELLWDHPEQERLYLRLEDEYELPDRDRALGRKLDLISQTATTSLRLLQDRRTLRVEWYIVILILVEIVIYVYELFFRGSSDGVF